MGKRDPAQEPNPFEAAEVLRNHRPERRRMGKRDATQVSHLFEGSKAASESLDREETEVKRIRHKCRILSRQQSCLGIDPS